MSNPARNRLAMEICGKYPTFQETKMKTREELILEFMLALVQNQSFCAGAEDDAQTIFEYARIFANTYLENV